MIITEQLTINEKQFTKTASDSGFYIERDGVKYSEAIDPAALNRVYTETNKPIEEETEKSEVEQKALAWNELTEVNSDE